MSASDSGLIIVAAPVLLTVGAVSLAASGISAAAERYKQFRFDRALADELQKKAELDYIQNLADTNRMEYEAILNDRIQEEGSRRATEEQILEAARLQMLDEMQSREQIRAEIHSQIAYMDQAIARYEAEFGAELQLREMAETIHRSREMFGDGAQLLQELRDLLFVVLPGMAEEKREALRVEKMESRFHTITAEHFHVQDTSREFVSLHTGGEDSSVSAGSTPWERFMRRLQSVAELEDMYYAAEAAEMLEEAEAVAPGRRNFYIQQHQEQLLELEEHAQEYRDQQQEISEQSMEEFCQYLAIAGKLGIEAQYTKEELWDAYVVSEMRAETERLVEEYKKKRERQYTVHAITTVMDRHQLTFENMEIQENGRQEMEYSMDDQAGVRISRSESGAFEMQFQGKSKGAFASLDEERSITEKAKHFCSLLPQITKELEEEFGITFAQTALQPPEIGHIEITQNRASTHREKARVQKAMQMK